MSDTASGTGTAGPAGTVLIVEDEPGMRALYVRVLTAIGFAVREASNGRQACRALETDTVDLILTDLLMPEMDGIELLAWLRRNGMTVPVLMISGANVELGRDYLAACKDLGAAATLEKPATPEALIAAVRALLPRATLSPLRRAT